MAKSKELTRSNYQCNVIAYIAMYILDVYADEDNDLGCYDVAYDLADALSDKFIDSKYDVSSQSLYDCIEEFMESKKVREELGI